jgi:hypothetical protein
MSRGEGMYGEIKARRIGHIVHFVNLAKAPCQ